MKMGWLLHCITGSLREHKPFLLCSVLLSNNFVIVKACSKNTTGSTDLPYSEKSQPRSSRQAFLSRPSFLDTEKSAKCSCFVTGCCFIHPPLIFATERLIISLQHNIKLCISFHSQSL